MNCQRARQLAALQARGELDDRQGTGLRAHLHACAECREAVAAASRIDQGLRATLGHLPPSIDLRPAVMRRISETTPRRRAPAPRVLWVAQPRWTWAPVGALVAAGLAVGVVINARRPEPVGPKPGPVPPVVVAPAPAHFDNNRDLIVERTQPPPPGGGDDELREGDRLRTGGSAGTKVQLADGTSISLDRDSAVQLRHAGLSLEHGRLLAEVAPQTHDFTIATPQAEAKVLGTAFEVELTPAGSTVVTVTRGMVRVRNALGEAQVQAGAFTVARNGIAPLPPEEIDTALLTEWAEPQPQSPQPEDPATLQADIDAARRDLAVHRGAVRLLRRQLERLKAAPSAGNAPR